MSRPKQKFFEEVGIEEASDEAGLLQQVSFATCLRSMVCARAPSAIKHSCDHRLIRNSAERRLELLELLFSPRCGQTKICRHNSPATSEQLDQICTPEPTQRAQVMCGRGEGMQLYLNGDAKIPVETT